MSAERLDGMHSFHLHHHAPPGRFLYAAAEDEDRCQVQGEGCKGKVIIVIDGVPACGNCHHYVLPEERPKSVPRWKREDK